MHCERPPIISSFHNQNRVLHLLQQQYLKPKSYVMFQNLWDRVDFVPRKSSLCFAVQPGKMRAASQSYCREENLFLLLLCVIHLERETITFTTLRKQQFHPVVKLCESSRENMSQALHNLTQFRCSSCCRTCVFSYSYGLFNVLLQRCCASSYFWPRAKTKFAVCSMYRTTCGCPSLKNQIKWSTSLAVQACSV